MKSFSRIHEHLLFIFTNSRTKKADSACTNPAGGGGLVHPDWDTLTTALVKIEFENTNWSAQSNYRHSLFFGLFGRSYVTSSVCSSVRLLSDCLIAIDWQVWALRSVYREFSIPSDVRPSVRPSVCPSVCPSVRPLPKFKVFNATQFTLELIFWT